MRSADHPTEEARTRHAAQPWRAQRHELLDNLGFRLALLRRRRIEYFAHCRIAAWWCRLVDRIAISDGVLCCQGEQRLDRHSRRLRSLICNSQHPNRALTMSDPSWVLPNAALTGRIVRDQWMVRLDGHASGAPKLVRSLR